MSLIEEALRKQREEVEQSHKTPANPPPVPAGLPPDQAPRGASRPWRLLLGLILGGALCIALILWLFFYGFNLWNRSSGVLVSAQKKVLASVTNTLTVIPSTPAPTNPPAVLPPPNIPAATQSTVIATTPAPAPAQPEPIVEKAPIPAAWPRLTVSGIIGGGKTGHSAVIINGKLLSVGDSIEAVKVVAIEKQHVKLICEGEERTLSAGSTTE